MFEPARSGRVSEPSLIGQSIPDVLKLFTCVRSHADLSRSGLEALGLSKIQPAHVPQMDSVEPPAERPQVGKAVAAQQVSAALVAAFPA